MASVIKLFRCIDFNPTFKCPFEVEGFYNQVVEDGVNHEVNEHGEADNVKTLKRVESVIQDGTIPIPPTGKQKS